MAEHNKVQVFFLLFSSLLILILFLSKLLSDRPKIQSFVSEPAMTLVVGIIASGLIFAFWDDDDEVTDDDDDDYFNKNDDNQSWGEELEEEMELRESFLTFPSKIFQVKIIW